MRSVTFTKNNSPYVAGETAAFDDATATRMVRGGVAAFAEVPEPDESESDAGTRTRGSSMPAAQTTTVKTSVTK